MLKHPHLNQSEPESESERITDNQNLTTLYLPTELEFTLLQNLDTPVFWIGEDGVIKWRNRSASESFPLLHTKDHWADVGNALPSGYFYRLHHGFVAGQPGILVECTHETALELQQEIEHMRLLNTELETVFDALDELLVTDGYGITLRINGVMEKLYNVKSEEIIGRSVFELEQERMFYPSVTAMVLRNKKQTTILQTTKNGRLLVVTGTPVFDSEGTIVRVITNANDITNMQLSIDKKYSKHTLSRNTNEVVPQSSPKNSVQQQSLFIAESTAMKKTYELIKRVAKTDTSVLLLGETGVGKNRLAFLLHGLSNRKNSPFVEINCASIPDSLLESELFGYERGAFTGARKEGKAGKVELAEHGTLFLNEIGELPLQLQSKLLDLLHERIVSRIGSLRNSLIDIRIIAATNQNLEEMVRQKKFREDLFYRLTVFPITIPPLRERKEDILPLAESYFAQCTARLGQTGRYLHAETLELLKTYPWPGNIRQLENTLERLAIALDDDVVLPEHLPSFLWSNPETKSFIPPSDSYVISTQKEPLGDHDTNRETSNVLDLRQSLADFERQILEQAVRQYKSTYKIAQHLNISQPTVVRKLKQYDLSIE